MMGIYGVIQEKQKGRAEKSIMFWETSLNLVVKIMIRVEGYRSETQLESL
jgi:hypothetical protein